MKNVTLLALDTATEACSVALLRGGEKTHLAQFAQREHTKHILPMVDEILAQAGITLHQVDALVFGRGPGSFTGVRIGAGIAQGLAFGAALPVIPVSNLAAMAQAAYVQYQAENVLTAIDARMNEVYFAQWRAPKVRAGFGGHFDGRRVGAGGQARRADYPQQSLHLVFPFPVRFAFRPVRRRRGVLSPARLPPVCLRLRPASG